MQVLCMKIPETGYMFQDWPAVPELYHIRIVPAWDRFNKYLNSQSRGDVGVMHFGQLCFGAKPLTLLIYRYWKIWQNYNNNEQIFI